MKTKNYEKIPTPVLTFLGLILFGAMVTFAQTPPLRANGKIAFASNRIGSFVIYLMNSDGSNQTLLTPAQGSRPAWSPDGRRIVFQSDREGNSEIYVMNADGSNQTRLTNNPAEDYAAQWSPDGTKIIFTRYELSTPYPLQIYVMNADGSNQTRLTNTPDSSADSPSWSPDGSKIVFVCDIVSICVMNADGSNRIPLVSGGIEAYTEPKWSPDGNQIAYSTFYCDLNDCYDPTEICVMNSDGSNRQNVTQTPNVNERSPEWSPDGNKLSFSVWYGSDYDLGAADIFTMNGDGSGRMQLTNGPGSANNRRPSWQPLLSARTFADFDGDGRADISVFRPTDRTWYLNQSTAGFSATQFGLSTDKITPADYDGDGKTDISVYRNGVWYRLNSSNGTVGIDQFGLADDVPVPADYTGNGRAELAVYRNGVWWMLDLTNNQTSVVQFGLSTDKPVVADYDGDGRADQAVYRGGEWHLNRSSQGYAVINFGLATDKPVVGDYDGDNRADQAVYRNGTWYILQSSNGSTAFPFGLSTDIPAPADYDGDGKTDAAVFRDGTWYLRQSTNGISIQQFGLANDQPIPAINAGNNGFADGIGTSETISKTKSEVVLATKTWDGGGATENWSEAANWSGDTVPLNADTVVFDATSVKNVTIDVNITVAAWQIAAGYTGIISQGTSTVTVNSTFTQSGGTFTGGNGLLDFNGQFTQNAGTFTASSGTTSYAQGFSYLGGTFNPNGGTVVFDGGNSAMSLTASVTLNNLTISKNNGIAIQFSNSNALIVSGTLTLTDGAVNATGGGTPTIEAQGAVSIASTYDGGSANVLISGAATRTVTLPVGAGIPKLTVNAPNVTLDISGAGTLTFAQPIDVQNALSFTNGAVNCIFSQSFTFGATTTFTGSGDLTFNGAFTQSNGTLTPSGVPTFNSSLTISGGTFTGASNPIDVNGQFTQNGGTFIASSGTTSFAQIFLYIGGTFNHNGGTVVFDGGNALLSLSASVTLNNLTISKNNGTAVQVGNSNSLIAAGTLTLTDGAVNTNGGGGSPTLEAQGAVSVASTYDGGALNFRLSGNATQTYTNAGGINLTGIWTVDKSGGTVTLNNDLNLGNGTNNLVLTNGTITTGTNIVIAGTRTITRTNGFINGNLRRTFSVASSRQFDVGTVNGYAPVTINATAGTFPATFTVGGKNGTLPDADTTKSLTRNWSLSPSGITSANLTFQYLETDVPISASENNFKFLRYNGTISNEGITSINTATNIATLNGVTNFSDWSLGLLAPLAANAAISGRVITADGQPIARTRVSITDEHGETKYTLTSSFGYYRFDEIRVGETYVIQPHDKRYQFAPQIITLNEDLEDLNFIAEP